MSFWEDPGNLFDFIFHAIDDVQRIGTIACYYHTTSYFGTIFVQQHLCV